MVDVVWEWGVVMPLLQRLRSLIRLVIAVALPGSLVQCQLPGSGITSHRLSRLAPDWQGALCWIAQLCPRSSHLSASTILKTYKLILNSCMCYLISNDLQNVYYVHYSMMNSSLKKDNIVGKEGTFNT